MTINWWTLGLQAVNFLILVWLLSRVFWRPVAEAITRRQDVAKTMLNDARATHASADAALAEVTRTRAAMAAEREALLSEAGGKAEAAAKAALAEASRKAQALLKAAQTTAARETDAARAKAAAASAALAVDIARKLLGRLETAEVQAAFLHLLVTAIDQMPPKDRAALLAAETRVDLLSAVDLDAAAKAKVANAVGKALGGTPDLNFVTDPDLIAGFEIRTPHFVLRNSWQADLAAIQKDLKNAI